MEDFERIKNSRDAAWNTFEERSCLLEKKGIEFYRLESYIDDPRIDIDADNLRIEISQHEFKIKSRDRKILDRIFKYYIKLINEGKK